jgi:type IV secretory pathway VirB10-like protein
MHFVLYCVWKVEIGTNHTNVVIPQNPSQSQQPVQMEQKPSDAAELKAAAIVVLSQPESKPEPNAQSEPKTEPKAQPEPPEPVAQKSELQKRPQVEEQSGEVQGEQEMAPEVEIESADQELSSDLLDENRQSVRQTRFAISTFVVCFGSLFFAFAFVFVFVFVFF